jgi:hypothetical protein
MCQQMTINWICQPAARAGAVDDSSHISQLLLHVMQTPVVALVPIVYAPHSL